MKHLYSGSSPPDSLKIPPTVGLNLGKLDVSRVRFLFWDLGGQASLRVLWDKYFSEAHAVVWVVDATDPGRFDEISRELVKVASDSALSGAPLILLANKQDLPQALAVEDIAKRMRLPEGAVTTRTAANGTTSNGSTRASPIASALGASAAAMQAAASSSSSSSSSSVPTSPMSLFSGHLVRLLPISALTGSGVAAVIELLRDVLPHQRRTQQIGAEKI